MLDALKKLRGGSVGDDKTKSDQREYVAPVTEAVATTFVRTVSGLLSRHAVPDKKFRITLHRVVPMNGILRVQQIAEYAGTRTDDTPGNPSLGLTEVEGSAMQLGSVGRVFDIDHLTVGLCVRSMRPCLLKSSIDQRDEAKDLREDMDRLFLDSSHARHMVSSVRSVLTIPFLSATAILSGTHCVNLVLYADSDDNEFFTPQVLGDLHLACASFREHIDTIASHADGNHRIVEWDWSGIDHKSIKPAEESTKDLKTLVIAFSQYGALLKNDGTLNTDSLQFRSVDAVDVVPTSP